MGKRYRRRVVGYELLERLGQGGFAEVWRARQFTRGFTREVCIKRARGIDSSVRRALAEEARLLAMLSHGNIVRLFDVLEDAHGQLELCLELVDGRDLAQLMRGAGHPASPQLLAAVGAAVALGLAELAEIEGGVVHRDVSPHNVMLSRSGQVKLIDLGIARAAAREAWTASGVVKGKPMYLSPEQAKGGLLTPASDLFALGVMLYELATGLNPWGSEPCALSRRPRWRPPRPLRELRPDLPQAHCRLIHQLLQLDPAQRPSPSQVAQELQAGVSARSVDCSAWVAEAVRSVSLAGRGDATTERTLEVTACDFPAL